MRLLILSLVVSTAAIFAETQPLSAQAGKDFDTTSCYFTSYQQCMATISGSGGWCYQSPYYHATRDTRAPRQRRARRE